MNMINRNKIEYSKKYGRGINKIVKEYNKRFR